MQGNILYSFGIILEMSEELSPEHYQHPSKERKRKLPTKTEWRKQAEKMKNPKALTAQELVELHRFLGDSNNPFKTESERQDAGTVNALRHEVLRRHGLNPEEWVFYTMTQPHRTIPNTAGPLTAKDIERLSRMLPEGIEMFVNQGAIHTTSELDRQRGREPFITLQNTWEIYIREKPAQIEPPTPQIEGPKE